MKQFLLKSAIICSMVLFMSSCGQSPENQDTAPEQPAGEARTTPTPEPSKPAKAAEQPGPAPPQPVKDAEKKVADIVESTKKEIVDVADAVGDTVSAVEQTVSAITGQGSDTVADVIEMKKTTAFSKHTRAIVMFTHKKHTAPAPDGYGVSCGECHHDDDGQPLELKPGDFVQSCMACHDKPGKPKKPTGMSRKDWQTMQLEYYYGAIHANCIDCHKADEAGPTKCAECHPRPER